MLILRCVDGSSHREINSLRYLGGKGVYGQMHGLGHFRGEGINITAHAQHFIKGFISRLSAQHRAARGIGIFVGQLFNEPVIRGFAPEGSFRSL